MQIKSLPTMERPLERAVSLGVDRLANAELLAIVIHTGTKNKSAIHLAEEILSLCDSGITHLGETTLEELMSLNGIGLSKAVTLLATVELGKRISTSSWKTRISVERSEDVASLFMEELRYKKKEFFKSVMVNSKGDVIGIDNVSVGELSSTVVHPREVYKQAIQKSAAAIIVVHNHPSGDPSPSEEDIQTTKRLVECGNVLGIRLLDHIVIGDGTYKSLRAMELIE